jgi:hypothetical protein
MPSPQSTPGGGLGGGLVSVGGPKTSCPKFFLLVPFKGFLFYFSLERPPPEEEERKNRKKPNE